MNRTLAILLCLLMAAPCFGHGGALDANGGHHDRKNGGYHLHSFHGGGSPTPPPPPPPPASRSDSRSKARTSARSSSRSSSRDTARFQSSGSLNRDGFGNIIEEPKESADNVASEVPTTPPEKEIPERFRPRLWTDHTEQFTITAKYTGIRAEKDVLLTTETKKLLQVPITKLSKNDQEWLKKNVKR